VDVDVVADERPTASEEATLTVSGGWCSVGEEAAGGDALGEGEGEEAGG